MLNPDYVSVDEAEERFNAAVRPSLESMLDVVSGTLEGMPLLFRELRRLDEENNQLRAERDALIKAAVWDSTPGEGDSGWLWRIGMWPYSLARSTRAHAVSEVRRAARLEGRTGEQ